MKNLLILTLLVISGLVWAGEVTLSWTPPTENEDGTPLVDLDGYRIYHGVLSGEYPFVIDSVSAAIDSYVVTGLPSGMHFFVMTAYNLAGVESVFSNEAQKDIGSRPNPPGGLTVGEDLTAFSVIKVKNRMILLAVGTIPAGTACDPSSSVNGHYTVDRDLVVMTSGGRAPYVAVADCS